MLPPALLLPSIQNPSSTNPPSSHRPVLRPGPPRFHCQIGRRVFSSPSSFVCLIDRFRSPPSRPCPPQPSACPFFSRRSPGLGTRASQGVASTSRFRSRLTQSLQLNCKKTQTSPAPAPTARGQNQPKRRTTTSDPSSETSPPSAGEQCLLQHDDEHRDSVFLLLVLFDRFCFLIFFSRSRPVLSLFLSIALSSPPQPQPQPQKVAASSRTWSTAAFVVPVSYLLAFLPTALSGLAL